METINNKYKTWHDNIIVKAKNRTLTCYTEKHHIIPKCLGGSNNKDNLVRLTAKEHFIVHMLLCKFTTGQAKHKMLYAFNAMCTFKNSRRYNKVNSRLVDKIRTEFSLMLKGTKFSKATKAKMSAVKKGKTSNRKGKKASKKTIEKLKLSHIGKKASIETKEKLSKMRKGSVWVNNSIESKRIKKDELQNYLNIGYKLGRDKNYLTKEYSLKMSKLTQAYWDRKVA